MTVVRGLPSDASGLDFKRMVVKIKCSTVKVSLNSSGLEYSTPDFSY